MAVGEHKMDHVAAEESMIASPYQSTTEPVQDRRPFIAGFVIDMKYIKSIQGMLRIALIITNIIVAICIGCIVWSGSPAGCSFAEFASISSLVVNLAILIIFALTFNNNLAMINWTVSLLLDNIIYTLLHFISFIWLAASVVEPAQSAAAFFCFVALAILGGMTYFSLQDFRVYQQKEQSRIQGVSGSMTVTTHVTFDSPNTVR